MRWASFFLISVAFHGAVLTLPVSPLVETRGEQVVPVAFLIAGGRNPQGKVVKANHGTRKKPQARIKRSEQKKESGAHASVGSSGTLERFHSDTEGIAEETTRMTVSAKSPAPKASDMEGDSLLAGDPLKKAERVDVKEESPEAVPAMDLGGEESDPVDRVLARPEDAYTPKPAYPERARREGREGEVLLRILVDQKGETRRIEVSRSSGFADLDRAAVEAVMAWRFHPARYGEKRVESWVKVPIIFRLDGMKE